jgi:gliding motility-associated-like protein
MFIFSVQKFVKNFYTVILCFLCGLVFAQVPAAGLIGAWPFSGNANDISGSGNNGSVFGATLTHDRCGNPNSAYRFNGTTSYIRMLTAGPTGSASRSISFWARTTNTVIGAPMVSFEYGGSGFGNNIFAITWNNCNRGVGLNVGNQSLIRGNNCLLDNVWHHIVVVYNSTVSTVYGDVNFYIDGTLQPLLTCFSSGTTAVVNTGNVNPINIGKNANLANRYWNGDLDDFYLYNRALTAGEVTQLYTPCPTPIFGNTLVCLGSTNIFTVAPISNATYTWTLPGGWTGVSSTNTISAIVASAGSTSLAASSVCGAFGTSTLAVSTKTLPIINVTSSNPGLCLGAGVTLFASGANTYTWNPTSLQTVSISLTPAVTTVFTLSGTSTLTGCFNSNTFTQTVNFNPTVTASSSGSLPCFGSTATLSGVGANTYTWLPGILVGSNVFVSPAATTIYTVTGATIAGCLNTRTISLAVPAAMTLNVSISTPSVCPAVFVTLTSTNTGGNSSSYNYSWAGGPPTNTNVITQPFGGNYIYTITSTDGNNCPITKTISAFFYFDPVLNAADQSVCPGTAAVFTITGAQTYTWLPGNVVANTFTIIPPTASFYTVTGTSVNGCTATINPSVVIRVVPNLSFNNTTITCVSLGSSSVTAAGGIGPYNYLWTPSAQTASAAANLVSGSYTASIFDVGTSCTTLSTTILPPLVPFTGTATATNSLACFAVNTGTASIALSGSSGIETYTWTNCTGSQTTNLATSLCAGVHTITVVDVITSCVVNQTFVITQPPPIICTIAPSATRACVGDTIIFSAINNGGVAPHTYTWVNGPATSYNAVTQIAGPTATYTYVVNSNDFGGCPAPTASIVVQFVAYPTLTVNTANTATTCFGSSASLTVTGAQAYLWYPGAFPGIVFNVYPTSPVNNYTVVGGTLGCLSTQVVTVNVIPLPIPVIASSSSVCENGIITFSAVGSDNYSWAGPNGFSAVGPSTLINSASMANMGTYTLTAVSGYSCSASTSTFITILANPIPSAAGASVCIGEPATMTVSGGVSYIWTGPAGYLSTNPKAFIAQVTNSTVGAYNVTVIGSNSCAVNTVVQVVGYPYPLPSPSIAATSKACLNASLTLVGSGGDTYLWTGPNNLKSTNQTLIFTPDNISMTGIYTLTAKNTSNCAASATVFLKVNPLPNATVVSSRNKLCVPFCSKFSLNNTASNIAPIKGFYFLNAPGFFSDSTISACFEKGEDKVMKVGYIDTNNCINTSTILINAFPKPIADFDFFPTKPKATLDEVQFFNLSESDKETDWTWFMDESIAPLKESDPRFTFNYSKTFPVVLIAKNSWGCQDTIIKTVVVDDEITLFVPNVFSPNDDGLNDVFQPVGAGIDKYNLEIFDKWGVKVFSTTDFTKSWDGTYAGQAIKMETYIWKIAITSQSGYERKYDGTITILR